MNENPQQTREASSHAKHYIVVGSVLIVLLALSLRLALVPLGKLNQPVALFIACVKAGLVLSFFMHLKGSAKLVRIFTGMSLLWLIIFFTLVLSDYLMR